MYKSFKLIALVILFAQTTVSKAQTGRLLVLDGGLDSVIVNEFNVPISSEYSYFPKKSLSDTIEPKFTLLGPNINSRSLFSLDEPILSPRNDSNQNAFRLLIAPTYGWPVLIRMNDSNSGVYINYKHYVTNETTISDHYLEDIYFVASENWDSLVNILTFNSFWSEPATLGKLDFEMDGPFYLFECLIGKDYHVIHRGTMNEDSKWRKLIDYMYSLVDED